MASRLKEGFTFLKDTAKDFSDDDCPRMAAALSYYTVFALPPLLLLILMITGMFFDPAEVQRVLQTQVEGMMGKTSADEIATMMASAERPDARKGAASLISIAALLFGATGAFGQLQDALNRAWEVEPDPAQGGVKQFIFKRVLSFGMILGVAFLMLVSLSLSAALSALGDQLGRLAGGLSEPAGHALNFGLSFVVIGLLFAAIFKILPDAKIAWKDVAVGAVFTTLLFMIGKFAIGLYLGRSNPGEAYGAAGSLAIILVWIYYSSMIVLFGAEFTQTWAVRHGGGIRPEEGAVKVEERKIHKREGGEVEVRKG